MSPCLSTSVLLKFLFTEKKVKCLNLGRFIQFEQIGALFPHFEPQLLRKCKNYIKILHDVWSKYEFHIFNLSASNEELIRDVCGWNGHFVSILCCCSCLDWLCLRQESFGTRLSFSAGGSGRIWILGFRHLVILRYLVDVHTLYVCLYKLMVVPKGSMNFFKMLNWCQRRSKSTFLPSGTELPVA